MIHPLVARLIGPRIPLTLVAGVAIYGLATPARALPAKSPVENARALTVVRDLDEQARFDAECAREAVGEE